MLEFYESVACHALNCCLVYLSNTWLAQCNTPKILIWFYQIIYLIWRRLFKIFLKDSPSQNFHLWQVFFMGSSKSWSLVLRDFHLVLAQPKMIFGKFLQFLLLKRNPMDFGFILFPFKPFSFAMSHVEIFLPNPALYLRSSQTSNSSKFQPLLDFISIYFILKHFSIIYFGLLWFTKEVPDPLSFWAQANYRSYFLVPST